MDGLISAPVRPAYADVQTWETISGISRRVTYELLGSGALRAIKRGKSTLIDVDHGLRYLASLPPAQIKPPRQSARRAASSETATAE